MFFINWRSNYAPTDFDRKFNYEQSFTYELPFGHGHQILNSGVGDAVLGGWKISGIISAVSGMPFTVTASGGTLNTPGTTADCVTHGPFPEAGRNWIELTVV